MTRLLNISVTRQVGENDFYGIVKEYVTGSSTSMTASTLGDLTNRALDWADIPREVLNITSDDTPDQIRDKIAQNIDPESDDYGVILEIGLNL